MSGLTIPKMKEVESSNIESIGHHADRKELHVRFKNGGHYVYAGVGPDLHADALRADSVGKFINEHVKGKFTHRKVA